MANWTRCNYTAEEIDRAGLAYALDADGDKNETALAIVQNWRMSHGFPLNTIQMDLRSKSKSVDPKRRVSQRIKKIESIRLKLKLLSERKGLTLSAMQDLGGCRAIVSSAKRVYELVALYDNSHSGHIEDDRDDYISNPKPSGYRGYHLIYRYRSRRNEIYNGLKIEIQMRSVRQHLWATAVEIVGFMRGEAIKSGQGHPDWRRFFKLMGSAMAQREKTAPVPGSPTDAGLLRAEILDLSRKLNVYYTLNAYRQGLQVMGEEGRSKRERLFLLSLDPKIPLLKMRLFEMRDFNDAANASLIAEREAGKDAVLVSVEPYMSLERAYPNYFLDASLFLDEVKDATR